jgi:hypothetical protein
MEEVNSLTCACSADKGLGVLCCSGVGLGRLSLVLFESAHLSQLRFQGRIVSLEEEDLNIPLVSHAAVPSWRATIRFASHEVFPWE